VTKTELGSLHVLVLDLLHDLHEVGLDASLQFSDGLVERGSDASLLEDSANNKDEDATEMKRPAHSQQG
jgi:uroporphyrinogen-III decarboxylase